MRSWPQFLTVSLPNIYRLERTTLQWIPGKLWASTETVDRAPSCVVTQTSGGSRGWAGQGLESVWQFKCQAPVERLWRDENEMHENSGQPFVLAPPAIWRPEHTLSRWTEHPIPRWDDTWVDDTWHRWAGHEEDWPSQEHSDGHEAEPGESLCHALFSYRWY